MLLVCLWVSPVSAQSVGLVSSSSPAPIVFTTPEFGTQNNSLQLLAKVAQLVGQVEGQDELECAIKDDCNEFVPLDAFMHASASGIMALGFQYLYEEKMGLPKGISSILAVGSTMAVGFMKELWDEKQVFNCFSQTDLFMNGVGILAGMTVVYVF